MTAHTYESRNGSHWHRAATAEGYWASRIRRGGSMLGAVLLLPVALLVVGVVLAALPVLRGLDERRGR